MTAILYDGRGTVWADSRVVEGFTIVDDDYDKVYHIDDLQLFYAGVLAEVEQLAAAFVHQDQKAIYRQMCTEAIVWDGEDIWTCQFSKEGFGKVREPLSKPLFIGSGAYHTMTAWDCGRTPLECIQLAMKRNAGCGGVVKEFKLYA
jgi:hypothetical protein